MAERQRKHRGVQPEKWRTLAIGGGRGGGGVGGGTPSQVAAGQGPRKPWSLTQEFNKSTKPTLAADNPKTKEQVSRLHRQMLEAARKGGLDNQQRKPISSRKGIDALNKKLSQPRHTLEMTTLGSVSRAYDPQRDRIIRQEIVRQQTALDEQRGKAKEHFNKSAGWSR